MENRPQELNDFDSALGRDVDPSRTGRQNGVADVAGVQPQWDDGQRTNLLHAEAP